MKKRILALALCLLFAAMFPLTVQAEEAPLPGGETEAIVPEETKADPPLTRDRDTAHYLEINEESFPDVAIRMYIMDWYAVSYDEQTGGCYMTEEQVNDVTSFDFTAISDNVLDYKGLELFPQLSILRCTTHSQTIDIKNFDLSRFPNLVEFTAKNFAVPSIDLSANTALKTVKIFGENLNLQTLILGNKPSLTYLEINHTGYNEYAPITQIDVTQCPVLETILCTRLMLNSIDLSNCSALRDVTIYECRLSKLDVSACTGIQKLNCALNQISDLKLGEQNALVYLEIYNNQLTGVDLSGLPSLTKLYCVKNKLTKLDVSNNPLLTVLDCSSNELEELDLSNNLQLRELHCTKNHLKELDLQENTELYDDPDLSPQTIHPLETFQKSGNKYTFNLGALVSDPSKISVDVDRIRVLSGQSNLTCSYNAATGILTASAPVDVFAYRYDTGVEEPLGLMEVQVILDAGLKIDRVELDKSDVSFKGSTPYVVYNGKEQKPRFTVIGENGQKISSAFYDYYYTDNVLPGTAKVVVKLKSTNQSASAWFKIYLPPTTATTVANVGNGIQISWKKVDGAKGYVIYRRAWNLVDKGWTTFERWNNTTKTTWTDTKVYAGTRYQYGIKAYFKDPMDNYNLGIVGPLKTTVRITTRTLNSVTPGSKSLTAKWAGSKLFTGYQVQVATDAAFKSGLKTVTVGNAKTYQQTIKGLKKATTYYVRVRSYHVFEGMTYYGQWSNVLSCKVK